MASSINPGDKTQFDSREVGYVNGNVNKNLGRSLIEYGKTNQKSILKKPKQKTQIEQG